MLKCNHDSGSVCICKDKRTFDKEAAVRKLNAALKTNLFWKGREWAYKKVKPCIFAEQYMEDESGSELKDYKIFCFNGEPFFVQVDYDRFAGHKRNYYDFNWKKVEMSYGEFPSVREIERPENLEEMQQLARKLSEGWPFLRVDFYYIQGKIYFGELTFYPEAGALQIRPREWNLRLGELIKLPEIKK